MDACTTVERGTSPLDGAIRTSAHAGSVVAVSGDGVEVAQLVFMLVNCLGGGF